MTAKPDCRKGFTLLEVTIVSVLTVFLAVLLSSAAAGVGKSSVSLITRSQLAQEMDFAVAALGSDLGGSLAMKASETNAARLGGKNKWKLITWERDFATGDLQLTFDADPNNATIPDKIIRYHWDTALHALVRTDDAGKTFTVCRNVDDFLVVCSETTLDITLTFACYYRRDSDRENAVMKSTCKLTTSK
jgi:hypothetical protein